MTAFSYNDAVPPARNLSERGYTAVVRLVPSQAVISFEELSLA